MIKFGKLGTEPLLEELDGIVSKWMEDELIISDSPSAIVVVKDDDEHITIILHDGWRGDY